MDGSSSPLQRQPISEPRRSAVSRAPRERRAGAVTVDLESERVRSAIAFKFQSVSVTVLASPCRGGRGLPSCASMAATPSSPRPTETVRWQQAVLRQCAAPRRPGATPVPCLPRSAGGSRRAHGSAASRQHGLGMWPGGARRRSRRHGSAPARRRALSREAQRRRVAFIDGDGGSPVLQSALLPCPSPPLPPSGTSCWKRSSC